MRHDQGAPQNSHWLNGSFRGSIWGRLILRYTQICFRILWFCMLLFLIVQLTAAWEAWLCPMNGSFSCPERVASCWFYPSQLSELVWWSLVRGHAAYWRIIGSYLGESESFKLVKEYNLIGKIHHKFISDNLVISNLSLLPISLLHLNAFNVEFKSVHLDLHWHHLWSHPPDPWCWLCSPRWAEGDSGWLPVWEGPFGGFEWMSKSLTFLVLWSLLPLAWALGLSWWWFSNVLERNPRRGVWAEKSWKTISLMKRLHQPILCCSSTTHLTKTFSLQG